MAGCFGNHPYDRHLESQLDSYLKTLEDNTFQVSGTITYHKTRKILDRVDTRMFSEDVDEEFVTRYEADNEVTDAFIANFCRDNGLTPDQIDDYELSVVDMGDE